MAALVWIRPDHDHLQRPFVGYVDGEADLRSTHLSRGDATLLSSQAGDPRTAADDTTNVGQTTGSTATKRVSPPPGRDHTGRVGRHRAAHRTLTLRDQTTPNPR